MSEPVLKDLFALIRKSTIHYNDTCEQKDVVLTDDFKEKFGKYLRDQNYMVDFYRYTAVITTPVNNYMFVPNQWFVIAAYAVGVYLELVKYKKYLLKVCEYMGQKPKILVPDLRNNPGSIDRKLFAEGCRSVFGRFGNEQCALASQRLWRFATDYSWWSGNKTADRADFYLSVVNNMLSLVAVSQSFVGEIVADYDRAGMSDMVADLSDFTETESGPTYTFDGYSDPKDDPVPKASAEMVRENPAPYGTGDEIVISVRSKK